MFLLIDEPTITVSLQIIIAMVTVLMSGVSVYVALRIALSENKKDIVFLTKQFEKLARDVDKLSGELDAHQNPITHPTRESIQNIQEYIASVKRELKEAHTRIEAKVDRLLERR